MARPTEKSAGLILLHIFLSNKDGSTPYNEFALPQSEKHNVSICIFFPASNPVPENIVAFEGDGTVRGFFGALKAALSSRVFDVVHVHSPHTGLLFLVARFLFGSRKTLSVFTVLNSYKNYRLRNRWMLLPVFAFFSRVVMCSHAGDRSFPRLYRRLAGERLRVVPNGVNILRLDQVAVPRVEEKDAPFTIISAARLAPIKQPLAVLESFLKLDDPGARLVFIGEGPEREKVEARAGAAGLSGRVVFTGLIPREEVFAWMGRADLFVSMSRGEGLPLSVLEALACRCPVILSRIPPHEEIAAGEQAIALVDPDDRDGLAAALRRFREMPFEARLRIGEAGRRVAVEKYSLEMMLDRYHAIYQGVLDG